MYSIILDGYGILEMGYGQVGYIHHLFDINCTTLLQLLDFCSNTKYTIGSNRLHEEKQEFVMFDSHTL